jgi:hypothetical protein
MDVSSLIPARLKNGAYGKVICGLVLCCALLTGTSCLIAAEPGKYAEAMDWAQGGREISSQNGKGTTSNLSASWKSRPIDSGIVIVDGEYQQPPYVLEQRDNQLLLNGHPVILDQFQDKNRQRDRRRRKDPLQQLERRLEQNRLLCGFDGVVALVDEGMELDVLKILASDDPAEQKTEAMQRLSLRSLNSLECARLARTFVPTPEFASHLSDLEERLKHLKASRLARSSDSSVSLASRLMPLATPVGMLITLFAAGTLLHHRPPRGAWRLKAGDGERVRAASLWIVAIAALRTRKCFIS